MCTWQIISSWGYWKFWSPLAIFSLVHFTYLCNLPLYFFIFFRQNGVVLKVDPLWPAVFSKVSMCNSFHTDGTWQTFPLTYRPSLVVLFHMPKLFNDKGFQAFSGLAELVEQGSYRAEKSAAKQDERDEKCNAERQILRSLIRDILGLLRILSLFSILKGSNNENKTFPIFQSGNLPI